MHTEHLRVTGMTCGGCTSKVTNALKAISGVGDVKVSLSEGEATVQYDERQTSPEQLKSAVKGAGYGVDAANQAHSQQPKGGLLRLSLSIIRKAMNKNYGQEMSKQSSNSKRMDQRPLSGLFVSSTQQGTRTHLRFYSQCTEETPIT